MSRLSTFLRQERDAQHEATPEARYERARQVLERGVQRAVQTRLNTDAALIRTMLAAGQHEPPAAVRATIPACFRRIT